MATVLLGTALVLGGGTPPLVRSAEAASGPHVCFRRDPGFEVTASRAYRTYGTVGTDAVGNTYVSWRYTAPSLLWMTKHDAEGNELWSRSAAAGVLPPRIRVAADGSVLVASVGTAQQPMQVGYNSVIASGPDGTHTGSWTRVDDLPAMWRPQAAAHRPGGGFAVLSEQIGGGPQDPFGAPRVDVWNDGPLFEIVTADTSPSWDPTAIPEMTSDLDVGSDGRIWVASGGSAPEGRVWVFSSAGNQVRHIDPNLSTRTFFPAEIDVVGSDLWVLTRGSDPRLHRIGPSSSTPNAQVVWAQLYGGGRRLASFDISEDGGELVTIDADVSGAPAASLWRVRRWDVTTCRFLDVVPDHPFFEEIEWMGAEGVSTGYEDGTYRPSATVTRQAMSAFMYRLAGSPEFSDPGTATFGDVSPSSTFFTEVEWMAAEGITTGTPASPKPLFKPNAAVSRGAMSAFMYRLAGSHTFADPTSTTFGDVSPTHPFLTEVEWMASEGITNGTPASPKPLYKPATAVSRAAMSAFMSRLAAGPGVDI